MRSGRAGTRRPRLSVFALVVVLGLLLLMSGCTLGTPSSAKEGSTSPKSGANQSTGDQNKASANADKELIGVWSGPYRFGGDATIQFFENGEVADSTNDFGFGNDPKRYQVVDSHKLRLSDKDHQSPSTWYYKIKGNTLLIGRDPEKLDTDPWFTLTRQ